MGPRGYPKLDPRNYFRRFVRFRLIAFQNTQKKIKRPSKNIFLVRRKLPTFWKFQKFPGAGGIFLSKSEPKSWIWVQNDESDSVLLACENIMLSFCVSFLPRQICTVRLYIHRVVSYITFQCVKIMKIIFFNFVIHKFTFLEGPRA